MTPEPVIIGALSRLRTSSKYQAAILMTLIAGVVAVGLALKHPPGQDPLPALLVIGKYIAAIWIAAIGATGIEDAADKYNPVKQIPEDMQAFNAAVQNPAFQGLLKDVYQEIGKIHQKIGTNGEIPGALIRVNSPTVSIPQDVVTQTNANRAAMGLPPLDIQEVPNGVQGQKT